MKKRILRFLLSVLIVSLLVSPLGAYSADDPVSSGSFTPSEKYPFNKVYNTIMKYKSSNDDVIGWLLIPNTNMNMPILFNSENNDYYSYRDWQKNYYPDTNWRNYQNTATYVDFRTKIGQGSWAGNSKNTVFYGHNWSNLQSPMTIGNAPQHIMFGQLPSYTNQKFAQENPYIYYSTKDMEGIWKVFAVGYCEVSVDFFYNSPNPSTENYQSILDEWKVRSMFDFGVDVNTDDRIITLSTCTREYGKSADQRFVVVARLLRPGESENDPVTVVPRQNVKRPNL